ncbi:hypothetical protein DL95DRAFT_391637 [Leptodontidium sp. 2 PMI_412]|nr:hypothetical protein DL95DRAFT_391637 [Leptodontidium sp. 2 PMI_412]
MASYVPSQEVASSAAASSPKANSQSTNQKEPALNSDAVGTSINEATPAGEEEGADSGVEEPSDKFLTECETVEEVLDALSDGFNKHQDNLSKFDFKPNVDFCSEEILTSSQLFKSVGQKAFNAGFRRAKEDAAELRMKRRMLNMEQEKKARDVAVENAAERAEEGPENGYTGEEGDVPGLVQVIATPAPVQQIPVLAQNHNPIYHPFGAVPGLYLGTGSPYANQADSDQTDSNQSDAAPSMPTRAARPAPRKAKTKSTNTKRTNKVAISRAFSTNSRNESHDSRAARLWFLKKGLISPAPISHKSTRPGAKNRSYASKAGGDWGTPRPLKVTKADSRILRKHVKYTTQGYVKPVPKEFYSLPLTHREARRYEQMPSSNGWKYVLERGDVSEEDPMIDGRLLKFELNQFRAIRRGKQLRRARLAAGEDQDDESSLSDDDSKYDSDRATCGWNLVQRKVRYEAKAKDMGKGRATSEEMKEAGWEDEYQYDDADNEGYDAAEEDVNAEESQPREESPEESEEE